MTFTTGCSTVSPMCLANHRHIDSGLFLQVIDVLSHVLEQDSLIMEQLDEVVGWCCVVVCQIEVLHKLIERFRFLDEVIQSEDGLWVRQIILLQVVVETGAR